MRTILDLPDSLLKEVKTRAVQQGVKLKDLLASYVEAGMSLPGQPVRIEAGMLGIPKTVRLPSSAKRQPLPVAIPRVPGAPLHPATTNAELYTILDAEDEAEYHRVISQSMPPK